MQTTLPLPFDAGDIILRQMVRGDAADLMRIVTIPAVGRMLFLFPLDWTIDAAESFIDEWQFKGTLPFRLAICDRAGEFLGTVGVYTGTEPSVFYFLDPAFAGKGFATKAMAAFIDLLKQHFALDALRADVFTDNPASARILVKLGFVPVGDGVGTSAARLEPAPIVLYRLSIKDQKA